MRLETFPLIVGVLVGLIGLALLYDAWSSDDAPGRKERRRRPRAPRHRGGEAMVALGLIGMGAALVGRDRWQYGTVAVIASMVLVVFGALLNGPLIREMLFFRGASRRRAGADADRPAPGAPPEDPPPPEKRMRIR